MIYEKFWARERFPVVYEKDEAKAIIVEMESFEKIEMILDNLINRDIEPEDGILAASALFQKIVSDAKKMEPVGDWRKALDEM